MQKVFTAVLLTLFAGLFLATSVAGQTRLTLTPTPDTEEEATTSGETLLTATPEPTQAPRPDLTQKTEETLGPLEALLREQELGPVWPFNPIKYAIRGAVSAGVPANTIVLLLLLPGVAVFIAAARHLIGIRGFGIFLPAALSVVFIATGPFVGIGLFLIIVIVSTVARIVLRKSKIKLQYLPRMALILHFVVLGILGLLFTAPFLRQPDLANISIFPVLFLVLLAEEVTRVQLGKSLNVAINLTSETLILALVSYILLTLKPVQELALLNPETLVISVILINFILGKYVGLRLLEMWRFRNLVKS